MKKTFSALVILLFLLISSTSFAVDKQVTLAWDHDGVDLAGFKIFYGTSTGVYPTVVDVGMAVKCDTIGVTPEEYCHKMTIPLAEGDINNVFFSATAYDAEQNESDYATEVSVVYDFELPPAIVDLDASFDKASSVLTFSWTYETEWLPKIEKWTLWESDTSGVNYVKIVDIPYDPGSPSPYTTELTITTPGEEVTKYYVMVAHRGEENNNAFSANSNEIEVTIDKMPPKSPFEFKIKIK